MADLTRQINTNHSMRVPSILRSNDRKTNGNSKAKADK